MNGVNQDQELARADGAAAAADSVWAVLRETREAQGLTIAEVARYLKLTPRQIEAMEAGDFSHLPEATFARGFVRNYARLLKLDPQPLLAGLEPAREFVLPTQPERLASMPGPRVARFSAWPAAAIAAGLLILLGLAWYYGWFEPRDEQFLADVVTHAAPSKSDVQSAESAAAANVQPALLAASAPLAASEPAAGAAAASAPLAGDASAPQAAAPAQSAPQAAPVVSTPVAASVPAAKTPAQFAPLQSAPAQSAPALQAGQSRLVFEFDTEAWVEVRDNTGRIIFSRLNQPGSTQEVLGAGQMSVIIGNAPGVKLIVNGKAVNLVPYTRVNVARLTLP